MTNRADALFQRLQRLLPPPNAEGWHHTRLKLEAAALGGDNFTVTSNDANPGDGEGGTAPYYNPLPTQDAQADLAEAQLYMPRRLVRSDADPAVWDTNRATDWLFSDDSPMRDGAEGFFADVWGRTLGVGRLEGENDAIYANRVLLSVTKKTSTNKGMASFLEDSLGISGVEVDEAATHLTFYRLNDGTRLNEADAVLNSSGDIDSPWACFIVFMPLEQESLKDKVVALANSQKAAGTRLVAIVVRSLEGYGYAQYGVSNYGG